MTWVTRSGKIVPHEHFTGSGLIPRGAKQAWDNEGCYYRVKVKGGPHVMLSPGDFIVYNKDGECLTVMTEKAFRYKFIDDGRVIAPKKELKPKATTRVVTSDELERIVTGTGPIQADVTPEMFEENPEDIAAIEAEKAQVVEVDDGEYADEDELEIEASHEEGGEDDDEEMSVVA